MFGRLPKLAGSRKLVAQLIDHIPAALDTDVVVVHAEALRSAARSFADELLKEILVTRRAARLTVECASEKLAFYLARSANALGVTDRLMIVNHSPDCLREINAESGFGEYWEHEG